MRAFLGLSGYYRRYIHHFAELALPLTEMTKKDKPNVVQWTVEAEQAFQGLKESLKSEIMKNPDPNQTFTLQTDASDFGIGAILSQGDGDQPITY